MQVRFRHLPLFLAALLLAMPAAIPAQAHDYQAGSVHIDHPWARATAPAARAGAGFMALVNQGGEADRLIAARTPMADTAELHTHINDNGIMRMRPIEGGIALPPGQTVTLAPGGLHVMMLGLHGQLQQGQRVPLTLVFEHAGEVTVELAVEAPAATGSGHGASGEHGEMHMPPMAPASPSAEPHQ